MANTAEVNYGKSSTALKFAPQAGENINLFLRPGDELSLGVDLSKAKMQIVGGDVIATLPNGGQITFVSLGMLAFESNAPVIKLPGGMMMNIEQILNKIQDVGQAPQNSVLVSGPVSLHDEKQNAQQNEHAKKDDAPTNDYNAYYVDPQPFIKPADDANKQTSSGKYLQEAVTNYTSNNPSIDDSADKHRSSDDQSKSKDNVADVSAALSFDIGFYQIKSSDSLSLGIKTVLGGTGSALGNVSKSAAAQFQAETLDYRNEAYPTVITADNPSLVNATYLTKLVRLSVSQPIGFAIEQISILGLSNGFQILNSDFTSANSVDGGWNLSSGTGFTSTATDGGEVIEFYIRYEPSSANIALNFDYLMKVSLTSQFDISNVPASKQAEVVTPELTTLTTYKDVGVIVKDVNSESDYTYNGRYASGFVIDTTPNENIVYTSKYDSTVLGGLSNDTIYGNIGNDTLDGNAGNDTLSGGSGNNILNGNDGIDTISYAFVTKYSDDFLFAQGSSIDPATGVQYANDARGVIVDLQGGFATGKTVYDTTSDVTTGEETRTISDTLSNIEYVIGSKYNDTIRGDASANKLSGGEGNDTLEGRGGADWLDGGAGNDWLIGSTDDYMIDGGDNTDTIDFSNNSNGISITLNNSANGSLGNIGSSSSTTIVKNVENVAGTQYKDIINGDASDNLLIGGYNHSATSTTPNDDTITGGAGADTIVGDMMIDSSTPSALYGGDDILSGGSENDKIYGDAAPIMSTSTLVVASDQSVEYIVDNGVTLATIYGGNDILQGGAGDDYINGGSGFDTIDFSSSNAKVYVNLNLNTASGEGNDQLYNIENIIGSSSTLGDTLIGNALVNTITGSLGNDTLSGLGGNDTLDGRSGSDWVDYSYASSVSVNLATGDGVVSGSDTDKLISIENVIGSNGADTLTGVQGSVNTLLGKDGNDIFYGYLDGDTLDGGSGVDSVDYGNISASVNITLGGSNADRLIEIENVYGSTNKDTIVGSNDVNILDGRGDNDILNGMGGDDTLYGGAGNDTLIGGIGADLLDGGSGQDTADYSASNAIIANLTTNTVMDGLGGTDTLTSIEIVKGSLYNDTMTGSSNSDTFIGMGGNDTFIATLGNDIYYGAELGVSSDSYKDRVDYSSLSSIDHIVADLSTNTVTLLNASNATLATDTLYSIEEVYGTSGNDTLKGGSGLSNTLYGADGDDTLTGNLDGDVLDGGNGMNLADYSARTQNLTVDLSVSSKNIYQTGTTPTASNSDTLANIQQISGGSGNDKFIGNSTDNIFIGGAGNDTFIGGAGNDTFIGGTDATHDSGTDTADYSSSITSIDADLTRLSGQVIGNAVTDGTDTLYGIENIIGTAQADTLVGDANANVLTGGAGDDTLKGNGGADQLLGGLGNDTIFGGFDGDYIDGGAISERNIVDYSTFASASTINLSTGKAYLNSTPTLFDTLSNIQNVVGTTASDTIVGKSSVVNTLFGGAGDDTLSGNLDGDLLDGGAHTIGDTADYSAYTASTNLTVDMGAQTIAQTSNSANKDSFQNIEIIKTGAGADTFTVNATFDTGNYTLDGGSGEDTIDYGAISEAINVTLNGATNTTVIVGTAGGNDDVIANIEDVKGSKVDDTIVGDGLSNKLYGNEGNDTLDGGAGSDVLYGGDGNDVIVGTQDGVSDVYYGGNASGTDTGTMDRIDYTAVASNITLTSGTNVSNSAVGADILNGIEIFDSGSGADTLSGGSASITIYGNLGSDKITGGTGNDLLYGDTIGNIHADSQNILAGGAGNDTLYAGSAGDTLRGDAGNDTMFGGAGIDTLDYVTNNIAITALLNAGVINGDGSDIIDTTTIEILKSGSGADNITGADTGVLSTIYTGAGNDTINGGALAERLYGEAGNDTLRGGGGADTIFGGSDNDLIYGAIDGDKVYGDNGSGNIAGSSDTLDFSDLSSALVIDMVAGTVNTTASTFSEIENITGGSGNDTIYGDANANILKGGSGDDTIFTSQGIDTIDGGIGIDTVDFSAISTASINVNLSSLQVLNDGYGNAESIQNIENINGGNYAGGDTLYGDGMDNTMYGNLGSDQLSGNDGNDVLYGDNVGNTHTTNDGHNTLDGGAGSDTLYAGDSGDTLIGGAGNDTLYGAAGADILVGGTGDDTLDGGGGGGIDIADYRNATAKVVITSTSPLNPNDTGDLTTGTQSGSEGTDIITNTVEVVYGSSGYGDTITGNANANTFYGWGGNDTISGGLGDDTIYGGMGDDTIAGNAGNDFLVGGDSVGVFAGWDTVDYTSDTAGVTVNLTTGTATDGSGGSDTLSGFSRVLGSNYADTLTGNIGADDLRGNGGDDWFMMSAGNDTIYGGTTLETKGDTVDFINASTAGIIVNLATNNASGADIGTDVIYEVENVSGSNFADTITGDANANILVGRALNDTILAGAGNDLIYGDDNSGVAVDGIQTGDDSLYGQDGNDTIYGGLGNDSLWGGNNNDTLYGGSGNDYLNGESGTNILDGGTGNDYFELADATATNTLTGGTGTDTISFYYAGSAVSVNMGTLASNQATSGAGTVNFTDMIENVSGSGYNDVITGNTLANVINGNAGNDTLYGADGVDTIYGGAGNDKIYGDSAAPTLSDGGNTLYGGEGNDTIYGGLGNDTIFGDDGGSYGTACDDTIVAISGNDGSDVIDGGQGTDTVDYTAVANNISVTLAGSTVATVTIVGGDNDTIVNVENFIGGSGNDVITGSSGNNYLNGGLGNDTLIGGAGNDILTDSSGNNTFVGGAGNDTINGTGATSSWLDYSLDGITEGAATNLNTTINQAISTNRGNDIITGINNITGSAYNDIFYGNSSINTINGGSGNDTIEGYGGNDILDGGSNTAAGDTVSYYNENKILVTLNDSGTSTVGVWNGSNYTTEVDTISNFENISGSNSGGDFISGNASDNTLWGNVGNDSLYGGGGNDYIDGGSDNDTIAGGTGADTILGGNGNDILRGGGTAYNNGSADGFSDTLYGNAGDDTLYGMLDGDTLYGGDNATIFNGNDVINYSELGEGNAVYIDINATAGASFAQLVGTPTIKNTIYGFNTVIGSNGNDTIVGNVNNNSISSGAGNDVIYFSPVAALTSAVTAGSDSVDMGSGDDTLFTFISELTSSDYINGSTGNDTITFRDGGVINDVTKFQNISNIEFVQFADVVNTISLDTTKLNDVKLIGGATTDIFNYAIANFDAHDSIDGGGGNDTLSFTTAGTLTDAMLSSISNIEKIQLANGTNTVTVDVSNLEGGIATLYAGTSGTNTYNYSLSNLTSADKIVGGGASTTDIIQFLDAGTVADDTRFSGLSAIDQVKLANGTNTFNIGTNEAQLSNVSIIGNSGIDTFVYTSAALTDGIANAKLVGSGGNDILQITGGNTGVGNANLAGFSGINTINLSSYTGSISLGSNATTMGLTTIDASGNTGTLSIDASAMSSSVTINATNANGSTYKGSSVAGDILNINNALTSQDASSITGIETINVNANTTFTGDLTGVTNLTIASGKTLNVDASAVSSDTTTIANAGTLAINNTNGATLSGLTMTGAGALQINGTSSSDTITLNATMTSYTGIITIDGGAGDDILVGSTKNDTILGGTGNDTLTGGAGTDRLDGGEDSDVYRFASASDIAADIITDTGTVGSDLIFMDAAGDFSLAGLSVSGIEGLKFYQGVGTQTLTISKAQASLYTDFTGYAGATDTVAVTGVTSSLDMNSGKTYTNIAKVSIDASSASSSVTLTGVSSVSNTITGGSGNDTIIAGTQIDTLAGGSGNDTFQINSNYLTSSDTISDTSGSDTLEITNAAATITDAQLTNVTNVEILKLAAGSMVTLGTEANNSGNGFTTVNVSAGGANIINNSTINNLSVIGGAGTDTLNISGGVAINASNLSGVENLNITSGTSAMTGTLSAATTATIASGATLTTTVPSTTLSGKTIVINGSLSATEVNGTDVSHVTLNSGGTANFTLTSGGTLDASVAGFSKDVNGLLKIYGNAGNETITIDSGKFTNAGDLISDSTGVTETDTLIVTGSSAIDFTKISGMEVVDLTNYNGTILTTNNTTGEKIKIDSVYTSIDAGGGTDQLYISANSVDLSGATLSNIESYYVESGATLTIKASDVSGKVVTGGGNLVVLHSTDSSYDLSGIATTGTKTLEFSATSTFTGNLGTVSTISVDNGVIATMSAASLNGKTATLSGAGALNITAGATAAANNFANLTNSISGEVTLNVTSAIDLTTATLGTALYKLGASAAVTLSGTQANMFASYTGSGNITIEAGSSSSVDLSTKTLAGYSGTFILNDGIGAQTLIGTMNNDTYNVDNAFVNILAMGGDDTINILSSLNGNLAGLIDGSAGTDVLNINKGGLTFNASNITSVEVINVNQSATFTGTLSATTTTIASGVTLSADASVISGKTINGTGILNVTNLDATLNADFSTVAGATTLNVDWSGTGTYTGNLTNVDTLNISSDTMRVTDDILAGHTTTGTVTSSLIVDVDSNLAFTWSNIAASLIETLNFTGGTTYTQTLTNVDAITLASGVSVDISGATIGASTTSVKGADGSESLTMNSSFLHTVKSVDLGASSDTLSVTGTTALNKEDFEKIHNVETLDLSSYTGAVDLTSTIGITQLSTGSGVNSTTINYAMNITDSGGTDTLYTTATMDLSSNSISGIETLSVASGTTTRLDYDDLGVGKIATLTGSGEVTVNGSNSMNISSENIAGLGSDKLGITGTAGDDNLVLDFSQLDKIHFDGGTAGTDTVSFTSSVVASGEIFDTNAFSNIETLDISSLGLSGLGLTIDANALKSFTGDTNELTLLISASSSQDSYIHLSNETTYQSITSLTTGDHILDNGLMLHVQTV